MKPEDVLAAIESRLKKTLIPWIVVFNGIDEIEQPPAVHTNGKCEKGDQNQVNPQLPCRRHKAECFDLFCF